MRALLLPIALLAACATTVRDLPVDEAGRSAEALVAGRLSFAGSGLKNRIGLRSMQGADYVVSPRHEFFLVSLPPGTYELRRFGGDHVPLDGRLTIDARAGRVTYIGSFQAVRGREGELRIAVRDESTEAGRVLADRYGDLPAVESALVRSSLPPAEASREFVVAVRPVTSYSYVSFGFGYPYHYGYYPYYYGYYGYGHRHRRHVHRRHVRTSRRR